MAVQLRVRSVTVHHTARGGVPVLGRKQIDRVLLDHLAAATAAHRRHHPRQMRHRLVDGLGVRGLDPGALLVVAECPDDRNRLRCAEGQVDPAAAPTTGALRTQPPAATRVTAFHQRDEITALHADTIDPNPAQRLRARQPPAGGLRRLALG